MSKPVSFCQVEEMKSSRGQSKDKAEDRFTIES